MVENYCEWVDENIVEEVRRRKERNEERCRERDCNWWILCMNKWVCWIETLVYWVMEEITKIISVLVCNSGISLISIIVIFLAIFILWSFLDDDSATIYPAIIDCTEDSLASRNYDGTKIEPNSQWFHNDGSGYCAWVYVYESKAISSADKHNSAPTRSVIIPDGYDPGNARSKYRIYDLLNQESLLETVLNEGYTAYVVDFNKGAGDIVKNSMLLQDIIMNITITKNGDEEHIVIGPSMGGVIARHALSSMEKSENGHNTKLFISFDSPQQGANIPIGNQYWLKYFSFNDGARLGFDKINTDAAKQMLIYHESANPGLVGDEPGYVGIVFDIKSDEISVITPTHNMMHEQLYDNLNYPQQLRKIAISNGNGYGSGQEDYESSQQLVKYEHSSTDVDIIGNSFVYDKTSENKIFHGLLDGGGKQYDQYRIYAENAIPYDSAPCGTTNSSEIIAEADTEYGTIYAKVDHECFIPTISAFDIDTSDPFYNIHDNIDDLSTPFDKIYYPANNEMHLEITKDNKKWLLCEMFSDRDVDEIMFPLQDCDVS